MPHGARQRWFSAMLKAGLEGKLIDPSQVMAFVTPEVLAHNLPPDLMSRILTTSLASGAMTPERLLETLNPDVLCEHVPLDVLWSCISAGVDRAGIAAATQSG